MFIMLPIFKPSVFNEGQPKDVTIVFVILFAKDVIPPEPRELPKPIIYSYIENKKYHGRL
jgi:hypothetical protein